MLECVFSEIRMCRGSLEVSSGLRSCSLRQSGVLLSCRSLCGAMSKLPVVVKSWCNGRVQNREVAGSISEGSDNKKKDNRRVPQLCSEVAN